MEKGKGTPGISADELKGLSEEERAAIEESEGDEETLAAIAGEGEEDEGEGEGKGKAKAKAKPAAEAKAEGADDAGEGDDDEAEASAAKLKGKKDKAAKPEDADDDAGEAEGDEGTEKGAKGKAAGAEAEDDAEGEEGEVEDDEPAPRFPRYQAPAVEKFAEQMGAFDKEYTDAEAKFKAGDIELDALLKQLREIDGKRVDLREQKLKHDISVEQGTQADEQA